MYLRHISAKPCLGDEELRLRLLVLFAHFAVQKHVHRHQLVCDAEEIIIFVQSKSFIRNFHGNPICTCVCDALDVPRAPRASCPRVLIRAFHHLVWGLVA